MNLEDMNHQGTKTMPDLKYFDVFTKPLLVCLFITTGCNKCCAVDNIQHLEKQNFYEAEKDIDILKSSENSSNEDVMDEEQENQTSVESLHNLNKKNIEISDVLTSLRAYELDDIPRYEFFGDKLFLKGFRNPCGFYSQVKDYVYNNTLTFTVFKILSEMMMALPIEEYLEWMSVGIELFKKGKIDYYSLDYILFVEACAMRLAMYQMYDSPPVKYFYEQVSKDNELIKLIKKDDSFKKKGSNFVSIDKFSRSNKRVLEGKPYIENPYEGHFPEEQIQMRCSDPMPEYEKMIPAFDFGC